MATLADISPAQQSLPAHRRQLLPRARAGRLGAIPAGTILVAALIVATGCQSTRRVDGPLLLFPSPPEAPRIQFLTSASAATDIEGPRSNVVKLAFGDQPVNRVAIQKPYGVAVRDGVVYACDTKIPGLCRLDFKSNKFSVLGLTDPGRLRKPINLTIDPLGYKFVADAERKQVVVFGPDDAYVRSLSVPTPCRPVDVAIWENELYVLDNDDTCQVVVLNRQTGEVLRTFGSKGVEPGQFRIPNSICFDSEGSLYISDTLNWRIQKLTREGEPVWTRGTAGRMIGQFGRPRGLRVGPDGIIYVADAATEIVQMFNTDGDMLMHFGGAGTVPGSMVLPASVAVGTESVRYFERFIHEDFDAQYLLFVSNQFGEHLISVYAFGSFPDGYQFTEGQIAAIPPPPPNQREVPSTAPQDTSDTSGQAPNNQPSERRE